MRCIFARRFVHWADVVTLRPSFITVMSGRSTRIGKSITAAKRLSNRWQVLAGYTYARAKFTNLSVGTSPNAFLNTEGPIYNDRPHQFKLTGSYILGYDIYVGANYRFQNGPPINRQISAPLSFGGGSTTFNIDPQGTDRLPSLQTMDLRVAKTLKVGGKRTVEVDLDISNLTNADTAWEFRSLTGRLNVRKSGDPNGEIINIQQYLSPTQILGPRIVQLGFAFRF